MIAVIDYGTGNLSSVMKALRAAGAEPRLIGRAADIESSSGIVIPGVGHFNATRALDESWRTHIRAAASRGIPVLGICLGMQWLYRGSDEAPELEGLGILDDRIFRLDGDVKVPHVGWNAVHARRESPLFEGVGGSEPMYFTHAYAAPVTRDAVGTTTHGVEFAAVVARGNVSGMQFHPEKSGAAGIRILSNWVRSCSASG